MFLIIRCSNANIDVKKSMFRIFDNPSIIDVFDGVLSYALLISLMYCCIDIIRKLLNSATIGFLDCLGWELKCRQ
jgi:hypothetical protein